MNSSTLKVSATGLNFLKETAEEARTEIYELETSQKQTENDLKQKKEDQRRQKIITRAMNLYKTKQKNTKLGKVVFDVTSECSNDLDNKRLPSYYLTKSRNKRYPAKPIYTPFNFLSAFQAKTQGGIANISPIKLRRMQTRQLNADNAERDADPAHIEKNKIVDAIQSIYQANMLTSPKTVKNMRNAKKAQKEDLDQIPQLMDLIKPEHMLKEVVIGLQDKFEDQDEGFINQVSKRLKKYRDKRPEDLSKNCITELSEVQKLSQLFQKHTVVEFEYQRRRDIEKKGIGMLSEKRTDGKQIIKSIDHVGEEFDRLGGSLGLSYRGKIPPNIVKENLKRLKNVSQKHLERPIHNSRLKTEPSDSVFCLQISPPTPRATIARLGTIITRLPLLSPKDCSISRSILFK